MKSSNLCFVKILILGTLSAVMVGFTTPPDQIKKDILNKASISGSKISFKNWGLTDAQVNVQAAWRLSEGSKSVVVGVIDTGIDPSHKDLADNLWHDPVIKDAKVFGWNFVSNRSNPLDDHGHGTHVAGIIGAVTDAKSGVSGVARKVSIMPIKYYSDANPGSVNLKNTIKAIEYAIEHGARIINYSGGGPEFSEEEYLAIKRAEAKGILFVAAAGNERQDTDIKENFYYPAAYRLPNIITVAATDIRNNVLSSSNWGKTRVDVAAPGENIFSTLPGGKYGYMTGTSQATAFVTGMAALLLSKNPNLKAPELKALILASVDRFPQLKDKVSTGGRVNAYNAVLALKTKMGPNQVPSGLVALKPISFLNLFSLEQ